MSTKRNLTEAHLPEVSLEDTTTKAKLVYQFTANVLVGVFLAIILSEFSTVANTFFKALKEYISITMLVAVILVLVTFWLYNVNTKRVY